MGPIKEELRTQRIVDFGWFVVASCSRVGLYCRHLRSYRDGNCVCH